MKRDIIFPTSNFVFSLRVGGLLVQNGSVLLQKPKNDDYAIIGGHVSALETTAEALKREYMEELHAEIEVDRLLAVGELFFPWGDKPCHQICLYYKISLVNQNSIPLDGIIHGYDELENERFDIQPVYFRLLKMASMALSFHKYGSLGIGRLAEEEPTE